MNVPYMCNKSPQVLNLSLPSSGSDILKITPFGLKNCFLTGAYTS